MGKLSFKLQDGKHVLIPNNKTSLNAQNKSFEIFEKFQLDLIQVYDKIDDSEKYLLSNSIANFFVAVFLNNDGATFRCLMGSEHKGLMTMEELKNIKRDYEIAIKKKKNKELKTFLLLDLLPQSNRRADAIIITNDYNIELYDFSEGRVVEKINNVADDELTESELKQKSRKKKQQERIDSYKGKIRNDCEPIKNIIMDNKKMDIYYFNLAAEFYDFNYIYSLFRKGNYETIYIPNSLCFLMTKENVHSSFFAIPLKYNIDSPLFITEKRPIIKSEVINDIYKNDIYIGLSLFYAFIFITEFTYFKIQFSKHPQNGMEKNHFCLMTKTNKKKYLYLEDVRTQKWVAIGKGIIYNHMFMNVSVKSIMIFLAKLCNPNKDDQFIYNIIQYEKLKDSDYDFFILD